MLADVITDLLVFFVCLRQMQCKLTTAARRRVKMEIIKTDSSSRYWEQSFRILGLEFLWPLHLYAGDEREGVSSAWRKVLSPVQLPGRHHLNCNEIKKADSEEREDSSLVVSFGISVGSFSHLKPRKRATGKELRENRSKCSLLPGLHPLYAGKWLKMHCVTFFRERKRNQRESESCLRLSVRAASAVSSFVEVAKSIEVCTKWSGKCSVSEVATDEHCKSQAKTLPLSLSRSDTSKVSWVQAPKKRFGLENEMRWGGEQNRGGEREELGEKDLLEIFWERERERERV